MKKKILLVEDHHLVRKGIEQVLAQAPQYIVYEVSMGAAVLKKLTTEKIDLVLLDISLPDTNGIEVLKQIKAFNSKILVCMLSMHPEEQFALRAFKNGASGYLTKNVEPDELLKAVDKILSGGKYVSPAFAEILLSDLQSEKKEKNYHALSDREYQIFRRIAKGESLSEISEKLNLSVKTVSTYKSRMMEKMQFKSISDLTTYAINNNII